MRRTGVLTVGVLAAALLVTGCGQAGAAPADPLRTEAYVEPGDGVVSRVADAGARSETIGVDGVTLQDSGAALAEPPAGLARLARTAEHAGAHAELLLSNFSTSIGDFSPETGTALLSSATNRDRVATAVAQMAERNGFDGVQIDLESLRGQDRAGLVAFTASVRKAVRAEIGRDARVSIAVMASTSGSGYRDTGYDLRGIAQHVDRVVLMTYDQHGPWSDPGTVGSLPWARKVVRAAEAAGVPRTRIDLGIAGYGYVWGGDDADAQVTAAQAERLAGDRARWSSTAGEWSATLADGRELHWSDAKSYRERRALARGLHLHGVALWSLNTSPLPAS
jgi:spore germination protein YaaH